MSEYGDELIEEDNTPDDMNIPQPLSFSQSVQNNIKQLNINSSLVNNNEEEDPTRGIQYTIEKGGSTTHPSIF